MSASSTSTGTIGPAQDYDPWGAPRSGGISTTSRNYTGQIKDAGTGLLYYNARYYDPVLARFVSADSIVPNTSHRSLTVDFHEGGFVSAVAGENAQGFWFQMSRRERQQSTPPWGPSDPQELNRYSYVNNNPLRYVDPSGHTVYLSHDLAEAFAQFLEALAENMDYYNGFMDRLQSAGILAAIAYIAKMLKPQYAKLLKGSGAALLASLIAGTVLLTQEAMAYLYKRLARAIRKRNGSQGIGIIFIDGMTNDWLVVLDRTTGGQSWIGVPLYVDWFGWIPEDYYPWYAWGGNSRREDGNCFFTFDPREQHKDPSKVYCKK